jgi:hypothetical protein
MENMCQEKRGPERFGLGLPLIVDGTRSGVVRDLSAAGIAFSSPKAYMTGTVLDLVLEHPTPAGEILQLRAEATVVRWECQGEEYTVGARLTTPFTE